MRAIAAEFNLPVSDSYSIFQRLAEENGEPKTEPDNHSPLVLCPYFLEHQRLQLDAGYLGVMPNTAEFDLVICILWSRLGSLLLISNDLRKECALRAVSDMTSPYLVFCCTRETTTTSTPRNRAARPVGPSERTSETSIPDALTGCTQSWCSGVHLGVRDGRAVVRGVVHDLRRRLDVHAVSGAFVFKESRSCSRSSRQDLRPQPFT